MHQVHGIAGELREFENAAFVYHLSEAGLRGGEQRRGGADLDGLGGGAELQIDIDFHAVVDAHLYARPVPFLEALVLAGHGIGAAEQVGHGEVAGVIGLGGRGDTRTLIDGADLGAGDGRSAGIVDAAENGTAGILREARRQESGGQN